MASGDFDLSEFIIKLLSAVSVISGRYLSNDGGSAGSAIPPGAHVTSTHTDSEMPW